MKKTTLGVDSPLQVSQLGLGCMGMSAFSTGAGHDEAESIRTIHRALDLGVTLFDTAENVRIAVEGSLERLGTDHIDLYHQHRMDPGTPIEENAAAAELTLSAEQLERLAAIAPATGDRYADMSSVNR